MSSQNMYGYGKETGLDFDYSVKKAKEELKKEGFGVLTEIDMQATFKKKLGVDSGRYIILGACNPPHAYKALQAENEIGLMLPCNVIVYEHDGKTRVSAILPTVAMGMTDNKELSNVAEEIESRLRRAVDAV